MSIYKAVLVNEDLVPLLSKAYSGRKCYSVNALKTRAFT